MLEGSDIVAHREHSSVDPRKEADARRCGHHSPWPSNQMPHHREEPQPEPTPPPLETPRAPCSWWPRDLLWDQKKIIHLPREKTTRWKTSPPPSTLATCGLSPVSFSNVGNEKVDGRSVATAPRVWISRIALSEDKRVRPYPKFRAMMFLISHFYQWSLEMLSFSSN